MGEGEDCIWRHGERELENSIGGLVHAWEKDVKHEDELKIRNFSKPYRKRLWQKTVESAINGKSEFVAISAKPQHKL